MCVACAARLISGTYRSAEEVCGALGACFKLNSVQVRALLAPLLPPDLVDAAAAHARARADELYRADGREVGHRNSLHAYYCNNKNAFSLKKIGIKTILK